jgi:hypothetical protein
VLGPELDLLWELESGPALGPVPTKSHTAQPLRPKLPGISSRFLLETNFDAQPIKGRLTFGALAASLSDALIESIIAKAVLWKLGTGYWVLATGFPKTVL